MAMASGPYDDVVARLEQVAEDLADRAMATLQRALDEPAADAREERRLTRARRSVEKAIAILSESAGRDADPDPNAD